MQFHCPEYKEFKGSFYRNSSTKLDINSSYFIDTKLSRIIVILPSNPEAGDYINFFDHSNTWNVNNLIILNNTKRIENQFSSLVININNVIITLVYYGDDSYCGWRIIIK